MLTIESRPWSENARPRRVLAMRFQAHGDTIITLPYLRSLKRQDPGLVLDFLTRAEVAAIPRDVTFFDQVFVFGGARSRVRQAAALLPLLPRLRHARYDVVLDLQNSRLSNFVRRVIAPRAWAAFDRLSPESAGERTRATIAAACDWSVVLDPDLELRSAARGRALLGAHGIAPGDPLVVLNPAGNFPSRAWPLPNYCEFARLWRIRRDPRTRFALLLTPAHREKAAAIASALGDACVNLTGAADPIEAFAIVRQSQFVLSEDSGLMHMAWVQGVPTLALFSSSRKVWSRPLGPRTECLDSSDLECGPCGLETCRFSDNRCLTRYSAWQVFETAEKLLHG